MRLLPSPDSKWIFGVLSPGKVSGTAIKCCPISIKKLKQMWLFLCCGVCYPVQSFIELYAFIFLHFISGGGRFNTKTPRCSYVLPTIFSRACTRAPVRAQIGLFVADVTSVLAEEESEAAKRYSRSAMGKSFSRKRSTMLPVAQERHSRASSVKPKWWLYTSFLPTYKSYSRKNWFRAVFFLFFIRTTSFCFIDTAIWCCLRRVLRTYIVWHCL